jgi:MoaA/NifB/PqqE/SkfB family radical SAM enzyme
LGHIESWPKYQKISCWSGRIFCIIDINGDVVPCDRVDYPTKKIPNAVELGFREAFKRMPEPKCSGCGFCGSMELNFLLGGKIEVLEELRRLLG